MQLTNFSYLKSSRATTALHSLSTSQYLRSERVSTGKKLVGADKDIGSIGQNARVFGASRLQMQSKRVSMQNFHYVP